MSNELVEKAKSGGLGALITVANNFMTGTDDYDLGGTYMKFDGNNGKYSVKGATFDDDAEVAMDLYHAKRGWQCWKDEKPIDEVSGKFKDGYVLPAQGSLKDHGPYPQKPNNGGDAGGWNEFISVPVRSLETGEEWIFSLSSKSGLRAMAALIRAYGGKMKFNLDEAGEPQLPVVRLSSSSFKIAGAGLKWGPGFSIVEWIDRDELDNIEGTSDNDAASAAAEVLGDAPAASTQAIPTAAAPKTSYRDRKGK